MTWSLSLTTIRRYPLLAAVAGTAAWGAYRLRARRHRARFDAVLAERRRIAREIHDTLAQDLLGASLQVESALGSLGTSPDATRHHLERARELIREGLAAARRSVWDLRDPRLGEDELGPALASFLKRLAEDGGLGLELELSEQPRSLPRNVTEHLLRIGQEAITNALRHSHAEHVVVELGFADDRVILRVSDDGSGFNPEQSSGGLHFGLAHMAERAEQMAARFAVRSEPGKGTDVEVEARF